MLRHTTDDFDAFRRDRKKAKARLGPQQSALGYDNAALRELEQVEAREVREQQLSREVHDFFAEATKQAATIVEQVAQSAEQEVDVQLQEEMRSFLVDAMGRMNSFVVSAMNREGLAGVAETQVEPDVKHLVGADLDGFRAAGSPSGRDAHLGQDPFATAVADVQAEFRERVEGLAPAGEHEPASAPSEVTDVDDARGAAPNPAVAAAGAELAADAQVTVEEPETAASAVRGEEPALDAELQQFKSALEALVRQEVMEPEEARAAWRARVARAGRS